MTGVWLASSGGEARFGEGDGEAAVGNIVGALHGAFGSERNEAVLKTLLGGQVDGGWFTGDDARDRFGIFGGGEFAPRRVSGGHDVSCPYGCRVYWARAIEQQNQVAFVAEGDFQHAGGVFESLMRTTAASLAPEPARVFVRTEVSYCSVIHLLEAIAGDASSFTKFAVRLVPSGAKANQSFSVSILGAGAAMGRW